MYGNEDFFARRPLTAAVFSRLCEGLEALRGTPHRASVDPGTQSTR